MTKEEHDKAVASLKEICREIGCSGLNPAMCDHAPQRCDIIRKLVMPANNRLHMDAAIVPPAEHFQNSVIVPAGEVDTHPRQ